MVNLILPLGIASAIISVAECRGHGRHMHIRRATTPSYTLVYSNLKKVPSFDDCINYTVLTGSSYSAVVPTCAQTASADSTSAKFFAVYQTSGQSSTSWWCGWWDKVETTADATISTQDGGDAIVSAYGYNFGAAATPTSSQKAAGTITTPAKSSSTTIKTTTSSAKTTAKTMTTTAKTTTTTSKTSSTTKAATTSKAATSSAGKLSTPVAQSAPTGTTTISYAATASGVPGYSFAFGGINAIPKSDMLNYWIADTGFGTPDPQVSCANHCSTDSSCQSFVVWQQGYWQNCAIFSSTISLATVSSSDTSITTYNGDAVSAAIGFNKGKDTNLSFKYTIQNPNCGMRGFLSPSFTVAWDNYIEQIDSVVTCANYCKSQSGCLVYQWQPSTSCCQTFNQDLFAEGYLTYDPTAYTFWYSAKCDLTSAISPTFRNTRLTQVQKTQYCGVKGQYNSAASGNVDQVYSTSTPDDCGKWCHVYPVFNSYRWSSVDGTCICAAPGVGMAAIPDSSATDLHYSIDCYSGITYMYTDMQAV
ncbi:hypothetical protein TWF694_007415 [Orbilia ellipsospora]|uniref:Apple domain-containing protein n=1 Tax=Orbilia ellipsospora TaxID=2528407 RepID=A0AAV9XHN3_9PEZI